VSATQTPPEGSEPSPAPAPPPERHCRRCGATLGADQEWCLACGAAATTEVARPRGWRLPLLLAAGVVALVVAAIVLAIAELSSGPAKVAQAPTATPTATPALTATPSAVPTTGAPENEGDQPTPGATATVSPTPPPNGGTTAPGTSPTATPSPASSFPDWPAGRSAWTIILKSATSKSAAESAARDLQSQGVTVGVLNSDDHSSLNPGYWVVFSGQYDSQKAAENAMSSLPSKPSDAYVRRVSAT
jgi:predicted nucleic acid-binding Zn ribbon protein